MLHYDKPLVYIRRHLMNNLSLFKKHDSRLSSWQADNQLVGKCLAHMQTLGYRGKSQICDDAFYPIFILFGKIISSGP